MSLCRETLYGSRGLKAFISLESRHWISWWGKAVYHWKALVFNTEHWGLRQPNAPLESSVKQASDFFHSLKGQEKNDPLSAIHWTKKFHTYQWYPSYVTTRSRLTFSWHKRVETSARCSGMCGPCVPHHTLSYFWEANTLSTCLVSLISSISKNDIFHQLHMPSETVALVFCIQKCIYSVIDFKMVRRQEDWVLYVLPCINQIFSKQCSHTILLSFWIIS